MTTENKNTDIHSQISSDRAIGALLGVAIGDALGWPQERPEFNLGKGSRQAKSPRIPFQEWRRRAGGYYQAYDELIKSGEYSDDTQLILATARSLLKGKHWNGFFVRQELPVWLLYQRGAGKAVNTAAKVWQNKKTPWQSNEVAKSYFETGANGAAMRVLPHAVISTYQSDVEMQMQVMLNSVLTHGHPRAILGAMLYAQAARFMLRVEQTLAFGALVEYLFDTQLQWSQMHEWESGYGLWLEAARTHTAGGYETLWTATVKEVTDGLKSCQIAVKQGVLASNRDFLASLGAFDKKVRGSGIIAALSAIYFASLYAADPVTGLLEAAFAQGADTDTIASMTGGLLGALLGTEWIKPEWRDVQDQAYLTNLATQLTQVNTNDYGNEQNVPNNWHESDSNHLLTRLMAKNEPPVKEVDLGTLGKTKVMQGFQWGKIAGNWVTHCWQLKTAEGQTIYITKMIEAKTPQKALTQQANFLTAASLPDSISIASLLYDLQRVIPTSLSASTAFSLAADTADMLENEKRHLGKEEFKARLDKKDYITSVVKNVQDKGYPVQDKDLSGLIARIGELLTRS